MAVLPLDNKTLYIVLYESKTVLGKHCFAIHPKAYDNWIDAHAIAQAIPKDLKVRAWVAAIERPSLIELVK